MVWTDIKEEPLEISEYEPSRYPQPLIAANDLLMRTIFDLVDSRADLLSGMLACKDLFNIPAGLLYKSTTEEEIARVWAQGCGVNRFSTYLRGVRELTIESDSDPIDMEVLLQRYELLERIYLEHEPLTAPEVMVEETYSCGDRRIYVRGEVKFDRLDLTRQHHPVRVNERVVWRDIRSLSETIMHVSQGRDLDFVTLVRSAMSDGTSPLQGLVKLNLSRYWISMYGLEEILGSLPNLKHLSCSLKSPEYLPDRVGRQPRRIIQETGAGIQIMDVTCHGIDLFYGLSLLEGCPKLRISGDIWRDSIESVPPFSPRSAEGPRTQYLRLAPSLRSQWKHQLPDPYQIARQIRYYVSPSCTITIVTTGKYGEELLWLRILSETLKSLQKEEDQRRAETKGWTKCDPPPEHK